MIAIDYLTNGATNNHHCNHNGKNSSNSSGTSSSTTANKNNRSKSGNNNDGNKDEYPCCSYPLVSIRIGALPMSSRFHQWSHGFGGVPVNANRQPASLGYCWGSNKPNTVVHPLSPKKASTANTIYIIYFFPLWLKDAPISTQRVGQLSANS